MKNSLFEIPVVPQTLQNHKCKVYQSGYHKKAFFFFFEKRHDEGQVYFYRLRDIAARRQVGVITDPVEYREQKG